MKLSMQNEYYGKLSLAESFENAKHLGFKYLECSILWFEGVNLLHAKKLLDKYGLKISAINTWDAEQTPSAKQERIIKGIETARALDSDYVTIYYGNLKKLPSLDEFSAQIAPCLNLAKKHKVTLLLETEFDPAGKDPTRRADKCIEIIEKLNSDFLKINFDPGNTYIAGEEAYPYAYEILKKHIAYIHLKDAVKYDPKLHPEKELIFEDASGKYICTALGQGAINYEKFMASLKDDHYEGFLTIEPHVPEYKLEATFRDGLKYAKNALLR